MKDAKFNYFKQKILKHLNTLIQAEEKDVKETKKSLSDCLEGVYKAMGRGHLVPKRVSVTNPKTGKTFQTTVYVNPNKKNGKKIYHADSKGARISLGKLKKQCEKCTNSRELMQLVLDNKERFSDENGRPLPMVQELSKYVSQLNDKMESTVKTKNIKKPAGKKISEISDPENSSHVVGDSGGSGSVKREKSYKGNIGDIITFNYVGNQFEGKIVAIGEDGVTVDGTGKSKGVRYKILNENILKTMKNSDGTIPANSFNANDYKKSFTDSKCTNDENGVEYVYSLLGKEGKETRAQVEMKLNKQAHRMECGDTRIRNMHDIVFDGNGNFLSGKWNNDREKLHNEIISKILSSEKVKACKPQNGEKPKFIMFGGRGGSGKSWFTDKKRAVDENRKVMFDSDKFLVLDADALKEYIPEYEGWNAGEVHEESSYLNKKIKDMAMSLGLNIIIDGTMCYNPKKPDKIKNEMLVAKERGYSLEAHYMFLPLQDSCVRAFNRFKTKKGDYSGRLVPTDIMLDMQENEKSFDSVKDIVDDWSFRDNQGISGPKLISKKDLL